MVRELAIYSSLQLSAQKPSLLVGHVVFLSLKTSWFKWHPDYMGAAHAFDKAGT